MLKNFVDPVLWNEIAHNGNELLQLKKAQSIALPSKAMTQLKLIGLGWSPDGGCGQVDIDLHVFLLSKTSIKEHIYFGNKTSASRAFKVLLVISIFVYQF